MYGGEDVHPNVCAASVKVDKRHHNLLVFETPRTVEAVLDIAKVADMLLLVITPSLSGEPEDLGVDQLGDHFVEVIKAQGVPTVLGVVQVGSCCFNCFVV